jgi:transposase
MRYELSDDEWATIRPMLPNKTRGVPRVDDRRMPARLKCRRLFLGCGGRHTFPRRSGCASLIAVAVHASDVEEASCHAEGVSLAHGRGASVRLAGC